MKFVGARKENPVIAATSGDSLSVTLAFSSDLAKLAGGRVMFPKGVFRYKTHEEANAHQEACLAEGMAQLARQRDGQRG